MRKGVSQVVTAALYVGVTVTAISTALTVGGPAIDNMRDAAAIENARNFMQQLDSNVEQVVSEGEGSTRTLTFDFDRGRFYYDNDSDALVYELETDAGSISPQASRRTGNVIVSKNANVTVKNATVNGESCYLMSNRIVDICINDTGTPSKEVNINTSQLVVAYNYTGGDREQKFNGSMFVQLDSIPSSGWGTGYTRVHEYGSFIGTGRVTAHVDSNEGYVYDVVFSLPTGADFIKVDVQNFQ